MATNSPHKNTRSKLAKEGQGAILLTERNGRTGKKGQRTLNKKDW